MKRFIVIAAACLMMFSTAFPLPVSAADPGDGLSTAEKMEWWNEAKFGLFVHWGPYCLYGGVYNGYRQKRGGAEWIMNRCKIPVREYRAKATTFNPVDFDAEDLVLMAKNAGMKYVVLTSKHHDGFAMFKSDASKFNIVDYTKFDRDVVDELAKACKKYGMKLGLYYSHAQDWNNPGGSTARKVMSEGWENPDSAMVDAFTEANHGAWDPIQLERSFNDYFHQVSLPQVRELLSRYGDQLAILWFDTPTRMTDECAQEMMDLLKDYPHIITNDRLKRPNFAGDYKTPEGKVPKPEDVEGVYWETCMNIGSSWGFKSWESNWKSTDDVIRTLIMCAARGGNLLLNVGPDPMGIVPDPAKDCLKGVGEWLKTHGEIIYGTQRSGLYPQWGECIRKDEGKTTSLYLCVYDWPSDGILKLESPYRASSASMYDNGKSLKVRSSKGVTTVELPQRPAGDFVTVIKLNLAKKLPPVVLKSNQDKFFEIADEN